MPVHVPVYIVHVRVIECTFLSEKKIYSPEASGGLHAIWNTLLNFLKKMVYKDVKYYCIISYKMLGFL